MNIQMVPEEHLSRGTGARLPEEMKRDRKGRLFTTLIESDMKVLLT